MSQCLTQPAPFKALKHPPGGRVDFYVDERGRAATKGTPQARQVDFNRHVHVVYNAESKGGETTGIVMIQVTDRTQKHAMDHLHHTPSKARVGGHHEVTVFLRPQTPAQIEAEVHRAVEMLKSRTRGNR